jgi:hypothetical protein
VATKEILAIGITLLVHVLALIALVWTLLGEPEDRPDWRDWWPGDEDDGPREPSPAAARRRTCRCGTPCRAPFALREPARAAGQCAGRRRPAHPPERVPERSPRRAERGRCAGKPLGACG